MGKNLKKFKKGLINIGNNINKYAENKINNNKEYSGYNSNKINPNNKVSMGDYSYNEEEDNVEELNEDIEDNEEYENNNYNDYDDVGIQPAQKPESFHHFVLENKYKDLERSIRGLKNVWDKDTQTWKAKRKDIHCFTDEEAEDILRLAQSHLSSDIKLGYFTIEAFNGFMNILLNELFNIFREIAEYRYGRYGDFEKQGQMKLQNKKIFVELYNRIYANYSRAIKGAENKATHEGVRGQESLQSGERDYTGNNRGYS